MKIGTNFDVVEGNIGTLKNAGNTLAKLKDGLQHPSGNINTPTPKVIREKYTQITNLFQEYGALVVNDAKRIEQVPHNMKSFDENAGRR